ncbi:MAG: type II toxin-antitoxin system Phd/YefM family antitoxin [Actinobacteria bacterium]|nr:type II toxin-antitoxin system Phd/YefM family antitoxin [Cyanobacteriota bacterium]MCL5771635.1 type II toxin-antitoxin system Phd/YefM family antitoxin [Actinomycetota bacterium]
MVNIITANELKTKGVSALNKVASDEIETAITVRGKTKYIVLPIETYNYLRECELESALGQSKMDIETGNFIEESVEDHIKRITSG